MQTKAGHTKLPAGACNDIAMLVARRLACRLPAYRPLTSRLPMPDSAAIGC